MVGVETAPRGWTVHTCEQTGDGTRLLDGGAMDTETSSHIHDLFHEDAQGFQQSSQPWWRINLFVWEPVLFGTWDGVFTTCMINIFGVVLFLRTGYLVCVAGAMYITGFSESVAQLLHLQSQWAVQAMSIAVLLALLGINLAGVKWIVRLQLLLLAVLAVSTLDFVIGTFAHLDPEHGFIGYSSGLLSSNTMPDYSPGENFFTVFGVFFPAATGVMAGFNMSPDLQRPEHNIPVGTLAAVFTSWFLYLVFVFLLGAICTREALRYDFLIAEKVSLVGFLFLLGLYISSLASCMGGLYGAPRILQCIAQERVIPALAFLGQGRGPNKTPVAAICLTSLLTMAFIFIGRVNVLAPIVSINFMLTYSFIDYSYFSVAMTFQLQTKDQRDSLLSKHRRPSRSTRQSANSLNANTVPDYGSGGGNMQGKGTLLEFTKDMDQIFPPLSNAEAGARRSLSKEKRNSADKGRKAYVTTKQKLLDSFGFDVNSNMFSDENEETRPASAQEEAEVANGDVKTEQGSELHSKTHDVEQDISTHSHIHNAGADGKREHQYVEIKSMQDSVYANFCNHWVALLGALTSILIMFVIQWVYALANIVIALLLYLYIGKTNPGLPTGIAARFSFFTWLKSTLKSICRTKGLLQEEMVVTPSLSGFGLKTKQLTEENADFASRHRHHQSSFIRADKMVQPALH
ncbi:solute carrier family 12 member 8 isoform X2 [Halichoeres trimaculatus]|uniref:solute carrier family 12 member 8 isoform X2 n=1 Tax=Halichoeres trimaculatus TaxID=147232 RepID=UPI003D9E7182